jgi:hypothetical protein
VSLCKIKYAALGENCRVLFCFLKGARMLRTIRNQQFKMMLSPDEKYRIFRLAQNRGISQADVMRLAFTQLEKLDEQTGKQIGPSQEQPVAVA